MISKKEVIIRQAKKEILDPVWKSIMENKEYSLEERNIYLLMTEKFLNRLSLMNWYIILKFFKDKEGFSQINIAIRHLLQIYMEKSRGITTRNFWRVVNRNITIPAVSTDPGQLRHKYLPQRSLRRDREGGNRAVLPRTHQNNAMGSGSPGNDFLCTRQ